MQLLQWNMSPQQQLGPDDKDAGMRSAQLLSSRLQV